MNKTFDCVEMKRKGVELLQKKLAGLTLEEELKFWAEKNQQIKKSSKTKSVKKRDKKLIY
jgi:hypothetical protein